MVARTPAEDTAPPAPTPAEDTAHGRPRPESFCPLLSICPQSLETLSLSGWGGLVWSLM